MSWSWSGDTLDWRRRRVENMLAGCATCYNIVKYGSYLSIKIPELLDDCMSSWSGDTLDWRSRREENMLSDFCEKYRDILLAWNNIILINNVLVIPPFFANYIQVGHMIQIENSSSRCRCNFPFFVMSSINWWKFCLIYNVELSIGCQGVDFIQKNPWHRIVEYHPYTWENYSQYNNNSQMITYWILTEHLKQRLPKLNIFSNEGNIFIKIS